MKNFSDIVKLNPSQRVQKLREFAQRLNVPRVSEARMPIEVTNDANRRNVSVSLQVVETLKFWNFEFQPELVSVAGRTLHPEQIMFAGNRCESGGEKAEWQGAFRSQKMLVTMPLDKWILVYPQKMEYAAREFCKEMSLVGRPMGMDIAQPRM